ncbi:TetR family transcriptional regulator [Williamsia sp. Leaf354]|uniref:TetR/AcrR family transcriptional regulator n=1 Tax=Williamsia sp. Leaf354 TaxID=1736349 RepID=UPI0006F3A762|nr:TetR family transcriptional regulator [Williamsia sp. Leaf354]
MSIRQPATTGPGRPRLVAQRRVGGNPREEILDAAGELFTTQGFAGTSTRAIAEAVGLRQASLYHHFGTKEDILAALLQETVSPTMDFALALDPDADARDRMTDLVRFDVDQLVTSRWNLGALYLLPDVRGERFEDFRSARLALRDVYAAIAGEIVGHDDPRTAVPFRLVESVIALRSDGELGANEPAGRAAVTDLVVGAVLRILR